MSMAHKDKGFNKEEMYKGYRQVELEQVCRWELDKLRKLLMKGKFEKGLDRDKLLQE